MKRSRFVSPVFMLVALVAVEVSAAGAATSTPKVGGQATHQVCEDVVVRHKKPVQDEHKIAGTVLGAVAGGLLGNQFGGGKGKKLAAVAGAAAGGYAGNRVQEEMQERDTYTTTERRCREVSNESKIVPR